MWQTALGRMYLCVLASADVSVLDGAFVQQSFIHARLFVFVCTSVNVRDRCQFLCQG